MGRQEGVCEDSCESCEGVVLPLECLAQHAADEARGRLVGGVTGMEDETRSISSSHRGDPQAADSPFVLEHGIMPQNLTTDPSSLSNDEAAFSSAAERLHDRGDESGGAPQPPSQFLDARVDVFVSDAVQAAHRVTASTVGVAALVGTCVAGVRMGREVMAVVNSMAGAVARETVTRTPITKNSNSRQAAKGHGEQQQDISTPSHSCTSSTHQSNSMHSLQPSGLVSGPASVAELEPASGPASGHVSAPALGSSEVLSASATSAGVSVILGVRSIARSADLIRSLLSSPRCSQVVLAGAALPALLQAAALLFPLTPIPNTGHCFRLATEKAGGPTAGDDVGSQQHVSGSCLEDGLRQSGAMLQSGDGNVSHKEAELAQQLLASLPPSSLSKLILPAGLLTAPQLSSPGAVTASSTLPAGTSFTRQDLGSEQLRHTSAEARPSHVEVCLRELAEACSSNGQVWQRSMPLRASSLCSDMLSSACNNGPIRLVWSAENSVR